MTEETPSSSSFHDYHVTEEEIKEAEERHRKEKEEYRRDPEAYKKARSLEIEGQKGFSLALSENMLIIRQLWRDEISEQKALRLIYESGIRFLSKAVREDEIDYEIVKRRIQALQALGQDCPEYVMHDAMETLQAIQGVINYRREQIQRLEEKSRGRDYHYTDEDDF